MLENLTQSQFEQVIEIIIYYKKCCPDEGVYLTVQSFKKATDYFQKHKMFMDTNELSGLV